MTRYRVAYVEWTDSGVIAGGWEDRAQVLERAQHTERLFAAGLLVQRTDEGVVLCAGFNGRIDDVVSCLAIPATAIVRLELWDPPSTPAREAA